MSESTRELQSIAGWERVASRLKQPPACLYLVTGHSSAYAVSLLLGCACEQHLAVIDGATRFNSYAVSRIAAGLGLRPKQLLRRTHVTRSFTAFQTETAITVRLPEFLVRRPCGVILVLGLLHTYYDEQISPHESEHSLRRILQTLRRMNERNRPVIIADIEVDNPPDDRAHLYGLVRSAADIMLAIQPTVAGFQIVEQRSLEWDETTKRSPWSLTGTE